MSNCLYVAQDVRIAQEITNSLHTSWNKEFLT